MFEEGTIGYLHGTGVALIFLGDGEVLYIGFLGGMLWGLYIESSEGIGWERMLNLGGGMGEESTFRSNF